MPPKYGGPQARRGSALGGGGAASKAEAGRPLATPTDDHAPPAAPRLLMHKYRPSCARLDSRGGRQTAPQHAAAARARRGAVTAEGGGAAGEA